MTQALFIQITKKKVMRRINIFVKPYPPLTRHPKWKCLYFWTTPVAPRVRSPAAMSYHASSKRISGRIRNGFVSNLIVSRILWAPHHSPSAFTALILCWCCSVIARNMKYCLLQTAALTYALSSVYGCQLMQMCLMYFRQPLFLQCTAIS